MVTSVQRVTAISALAMALAAACGGSSTSMVRSASDGSSSAPVALPTGAPQDPALALSSSPPSLADFNHAQKLCNAPAAQAAAGGGTLAGLHALTAGSVAAYMRARGVTPTPWASLPPTEFVAECDFLSPADSPAPCAGPDSRLVTNRVAIDDAGRHSAYPPQQCP